MHCLKTGTVEKQNKCMLMAVQHQTLRKNNSNVDDEDEDEDDNDELFLWYG